MIEQFIAAMKASGLEAATWSDIQPTEQSKLIKDSKGRQTIYYSYIEQDDRAWGHWYNCRTAEGDFWYSKNKNKWTQEQKDAWTRERKERQQELERIRASGYEKASSEVTDIFRKAKPCIENPYLFKKGVKPVAHLRQNHQGLVVPGVDFEGKIWTLQSIDDEGNKLFHYGARKKGTFFPINLKRTMKPDKIFIVEGVATGLSVYEATGGSVVVSWDAGNLHAVGLEVRKYYPDSAIVFCADNDDKGDGKQNTGHHYATQAAVKLGNAFVVMPNMPGMDWNDYHKEFGLKALAAELAPAANVNAEATDLIPFEDVASAISVSDDEEYDSYDISYYMPEIDSAPVKLRADGNPVWFDRFIWTKPVVEKLGSMYEIAERHDGKSLSNRVVFIRNYWKGLFVQNEFSDEIIVRSPPPWLSKSEVENFRVHRLTDPDINNLVCTLEYYGFTPDKDRTRTAIVTVAQQDKIHPVRNYFNDLKWDGVERLDSWLKHYCGAIYQPIEYLSAVGKKWLVASVMRIFSPGAKFDHMLVFEGAQGIGKSSMFRELASFGDDISEAYFTDAVTLHEIDKPAALRILQGKLIVEFSELEGMDRVGDEQLKRWITKQEDEMIKKYENDVTKYPRQFVLAGTTNNDMWLRDSTGNRRYWPVKCGKMNMVDFRRDKKQLWAEAVWLYKNGFQTWIDDADPINQYLITEQSSRVLGDSWGDVLQAKLNEGYPVSYKDIYEFLGVRIEARNNETDKRVRRVMTNFGWEYTRDYSKTKSKGWFWVKK